MKTKGQQTHLQIVPKVERAALQGEQFVGPSPQAQLFPVPRKDLLLFLLFPGVTEAEFREAVEYARPSMVLELRESPRFDIGKLDRQTAFEWFERNNSKYYDLSPQFSSNEPSWNPIKLIDAFLKSVGSALEGPIMLLVDDDTERSALRTLVAKKFGATSKFAWKLFEIPQYRHSP